MRPHGNGEPRRQRVDVRGGRRRSRARPPRRRREPTDHRGDDHAATARPLGDVAGRRRRSVPWRTSPDSSRASPRSRNRRCGSFVSAQRKTRTTPLGRRRRQRLPIRLALEDPATMSDIVAPANARRPVSISKSTHPNAQTSVRLSTGWPRGLLRAHVGQRSQQHARLRCVRPDGRRVRRPTRPTEPHRRAARPKSSTLTVPCRRDLDVGGLEIAVDDAFFVRRLEGVRDLNRNIRGAWTLSGPRAMPVGQRLVPRRARGSVRGSVAPIRPSSLPLRRLPPMFG